MSDSIVIVSAARTPMGGFQGDFSSLAAHDLGGAAIKAAVERAGIPGDAVGEVLFGNCLMAGQGQAPARQAAFKGGLPKSAGAVTLSKMCGSGMKAAMFAHDMLLAGTHEVMVAGGMESMTNAPLPAAQGPRWLPHGPRQDLRPHDAGRPGRRLRSRPRPWAPSARTAPPSTSSRARRRTPLPSPACSAPRPRPNRAPSRPRSRRSR